MLPQAVVQLGQALEEWGTTARRRLRSGGQTLLDLIFPPRCGYCGTDLGEHYEGLQLCVKCADLLAPESWEGCVRCGALLPSQIAASTDCGHCRGRRWAFETVVALGNYRNELRQAVLRTKRPGGETLASLLGRLHVQRREDRLRALQADLVVPVPLHWSRSLLRGGNGVALLAEQIAAGLGLSYQADALYLTRNTRLQRNLPPAERVRNVRDAFRVRRGYDLRGATVLLVDDVLTTGATAHEAARVLRRQASAARVTVAVVARAVGEDAW